MSILSFRNKPPESKPSKGRLGLTTVHDPGEAAIVDLVFVHGLNGGSLSTWSKNGEESMFWPGAWLPWDHAFRDVRIHTFGYSSSISSESILTIPDFARSLLAALQDSPEIPRNVPTKLILVGHSMGGLVIKKACILGQQTEEFQSLVGRICAIFFLATPHQGAGMAQTLARLMSLVPSRAFVNDLIPQSPFLQAINEEFPRYNNDTLRLFSFYEAKGMTNALGKAAVVVDKSCAVMNYTNERRTHLDANHRDVAKFSSPDDPSYISVRNALAMAIDSQRQSLHSREAAIAEESRAALSRYLNIDGPPEYDLETQVSKRLPGSCDWLLRKPCYTEWRQASPSRILWLRGKPGAGKSILTAHVINSLKAAGLDYCYFFFAERDSSKTTINSFLRSMAWQMAMLHPEVRRRLAEVTGDWKHDPADVVDNTSVWRQVYLSGILQARLDRPQYWVVDAADECRPGHDLMDYLSRVQASWPLNILVTSRTSPGSHISRMDPKLPIHSETISDDETKGDISLFLEANLGLLPGTDSSKQRDIGHRVLEKTGGSFLWASLVLEDLRNASTLTEVHDVLDRTPDGMDRLYSKVLSDMSAARFGKPVAKAILAWVAYCFRPLTTAELQAAVEFDLNDSIDGIVRTIERCCGSLIQVDRQGRVQLLHATAREFLTRSDVQSEFILENAEGHRRLALACLQALRGNAKPSNPGRTSLASAPLERSTLMDYASNFVFQHIHRVSSTDDEVLLSLDGFLATTGVLFWIEYIASHLDLQLVFQAGRTIVNLLSRRGQHDRPNQFQAEIKRLEQWATDLVHLAAKFSDRLRRCPAAIHHLIPPLCPRHTAMGSRFTRLRGLTILGLSARTWDDCLAAIPFPTSTNSTTAVCGGGFLALAMKNGLIIIYDDTMFQEVATLDHGQPVWKLALGETGRLLASVSVHHIKIWVIRTKEVIHEFKLRATVLSLSFADDDCSLVVVCKNSEIACWDLLHGELVDEPMSWTADVEGVGAVLGSRQPTMACLDIRSNLLAVVDFVDGVLLWDLEQGRAHDFGLKKRSPTAGVPTVRAIAVSGALGSNLLATTYADGDLEVYALETGEILASQVGINTLVLAASPDGRTLAGADTSGYILLFDFRTLRCLYKARLPDGNTISRALAFSSDSRRLVDVRVNQCRIWEPPALLRLEAEEDVGGTIPLEIGPREVAYTYLTFGTESIRVLACLKSAPVVFCSKDDGHVYAYDITTGRQMASLFSHGCPVHLLSLGDEGDQICSGDVAARVAVRKLQCRRRNDWSCPQILADIPQPSVLVQIMCSSRASRLLVSCEDSTTLWRIPHQAGDSCIGKVEHDGIRSPRWAQQADASLLLHLSGSDVRIHSWEDLSLLHVIDTETGPGVSLAISSMVPLNHDKYFATVMEGIDKASGEGPITIWNLEDFTSKSNLPVHPRRGGGENPLTARLVIGMSGSRLVFLTEDYWVWSVDLDAVEVSPTRHFFVPYDWISLLRRLVVGVGSGGEIVFAKQKELAVIKRGLEVIT